MDASVENWPQSSVASDRTAIAVRQQITAMASQLFEVGLFKPDAGPAESVMIPRVWDTDQVVKSVSWLRRLNCEGRNIYIRPRGEHDLSMVDDLTIHAVAAMKEAGYTPAVVVETSPGNYQAWLKHANRLNKEVSTAAARTLAEKFGGDRGAADWRHFGRLAGFTNRKAKYLDASSGLYPFVRLIEAGGEAYPEADRFLTGVKNEVERQRANRERLRNGIAYMAPVRSEDLKNVEAFRADARYGGDGTRIDLAYAVYAFSHGATAAEVEAAIRSRDLSHKGNERRQDDYVERTMKKALATIDRGR
jgi:RepB DNA-primase from phage plasmid